MPLRYLPRGTGGPMAAKRKNPNSQNSKFQKSQIAKNQNLKNFHDNLSTRPIAKFFLARRNLVLKISGKTFASCCPWLHSQGARCKLNASKQCPYEATTSTRLNSHGSEERTQEDTMNPMRRSPSLLVEI
jgi:hypothetical protein